MSVSQHPDLSVILAVRNEQHVIAKALIDLLNQDADYRRVEILVADGCSEDATAEVITGLCARYADHPIRAFRNRLRLPCAGINRLLQLSRGRFAVIINGHTRFPPNFLAAILTVIDENHADMIGGRLETRADAGNTMAQAIAACLEDRVGRGVRVGDVDAVPFPCVDRTVFQWIGGFREELGADAEADFIARCRRNGVRMHLDPRIKAVGFADANLAVVARQAYRCAARRAAQHATVRLHDGASLALALAALLPPIGGFFVPVLWAVWPFLAIVGLVVALRQSRTTVIMSRRGRLLTAWCGLVVDAASAIGWLHGLLARCWHPFRRRQPCPVPRLEAPLADALEPLIARTGDENGGRPSERVGYARRQSSGRRQPP